MPGLKQVDDLKNLCLMVIGFDGNQADKTSRHISGIQGLFYDLVYLTRVSHVH